jgi:hypothetical protein
MLFPEAVTFSVCPGLMSLPQEDRKALGALVVLSPSLSFANSPRSLANNFRIDKVLGNYKDLLAIEEAFCQSKSYMDIRPVVHWRPDRVGSAERILAFEKRHLTSREARSLVWR